MVNSDEKREFLVNLISDISFDNDLSEEQEKLYDLLLRDTKEGKLYKYRTFDKKGYSLKNLKTGTLHCAPPTAFNDPFDCKIGATFQSLYMAQYNTEFDILGNLLNKFIQVVHKEIALESCNADEQRVITKLLQSESLLSFFGENYDVAHSDEEVAKIIKENAAVLLMLIKIVLEDEQFKPSLGICASVLPKLMENYIQNGVLESTNSTETFGDFVKANGVFEDADEIGLTMLLAQKINPTLAKATEDVQQYINSVEEKIFLKTAKLFLIGCLCTDYKNRLMWSHYADSHRGFCVEYDYSQVDGKTLKNLPMPIVYSSKRPLVPWAPVFDNSKENINEACNKLTLGLLTKDSAWEYENEWRILINASDNPELVMPKISCIYLGAAIEEKNKAKVLEIAKSKGISVKQMKMDRGEYALHAIDII
jgi:hypothetical protein